MRYQVPQFVDIEDKIIGPFTLKQFLIYLGGGLLCIPIFLIADISLFITLALPIMAIAAAFAHVRIHGKTLATTVMSAVKFGMRGQTFIWQRTGDGKTLKITGPEFEDFLAEGGTQPVIALSLSARAQALETTGRIVKEDTSDPITNPEETGEKG